jgi:hypothetical protein
MHLWFERKIPENSDPHTYQAERRMINANGVAAFRAVACGVCMKGSRAITHHKRLTMIA